MMANTGSPAGTLPGKMTTKKGLRVLAAARNFPSKTRGGHIEETDGGSQ